MKKGFNYDFHISNQFLVLHVICDYSEAKIFP